MSSDDTRSGRRHPGRACRSSTLPVGGGRSSSAASDIVGRTLERRRLPGACSRARSSAGLHTSPRHSRRPRDRASDPASAACTLAVASSCRRRCRSAPWPRARADQPSSLASLTISKLVVEGAFAVERVGPRATVGQPASAGPARRGSSCTERAGRRPFRLPARPCRSTCGIAGRHGELGLAARRRPGDQAQRQARDRAGSIRAATTPPRFSVRLISPSTVRCPGRSDIGGKLAAGPSVRAVQDQPALRRSAVTTRVPVIFQRESTPANAAPRWRSSTDSGRDRCRAAAESAVRRSSGCVLPGCGGRSTSTGRAESSRPARGR